jgi:hypothetical protein
MNAGHRYGFDSGDNPHVIPFEDPLLQKLIEVHGDRQYESLNLESKLKQRRG